MGTYRAARNMLLPRYGLSEGCDASLTLLDAPTPKEAIISQAKCRLTLYKGKRV